MNALFFKDSLHLLLRVYGAESTEFKAVIGVWISAPLRSACATLSYVPLSICHCVLSVLRVDNISSSNEKKPT